MANIDGGTLSFKSELNNDQIVQAIDETMARVQGLADTSVEGGKQMQDALAQAAAMIRSKIGEVNAACEQHEQALEELRSKYDALKSDASNAFMAGRDKEMAAIKAEQDAVLGEIRVRERLLEELREQGNILEQNAQEYEQNAQAVQQNAQAHQSMRARIRELKESLVEMEAAGLRNTEEYRRMQQEVGRLSDAWADASQQASVLANDQAGFVGITQGLNGVIGGFTAASSAVSLLVGENENLQAAMLKVQQLMSITMGLQQVSEALNKDSAFNLAILNRAKEWWNNLLAQGTGAQTAETTAKVAATQAERQQAVATTANAAAQTAQTTAAVAGTAANITLAGAFRMVGAAIRSIPVFGWIAAGITALAAGVAIFSSRASEAKKKAEEMYKGIAENAYKPIASVEELSNKWSALGDNLSEKEKFIKDNKKSFDELGVSINGVTDAENLLVANKGKFIQAQIEKAKAAVLLQQAQEKVKDLIEAEQKLAKMPDYVNRSVTSSTSGVTKSVKVYNTAKDEAKAAVEKLRKEIEKGFTNAANTEKNGWNILKNAGIDASNTYKAGTLGAIEQAIQEKRQALAKLTNNDDYKKSMAEIEALQKQADKITGKKSTGSTTTTSTTKKDTFKEGLDKMKAEYERFNKWMNSGDDVLIKSAQQEFAGILKQGATYIEYLKNQREQIMEIDVSSRTKEQNRQLRELNNAIAEETRTSVLQAFNEELNTQLSNARTILDQLNIIEQRRRELSQDGTELDKDKSDALNEAEKSALEQATAEADKLLEGYAGYVERKRRMEQDFNNDIALMERARLDAKTDDERAAIDDAIANRRKKYEKDSQSSGDADYDAMLEQYRTYEQRREAVAQEYNEKIATATLHGNNELVKQLQASQAKEMLNISFDELKASPEYAEAFANVENVSTQTLQNLIAKFEECKIAAGDALNPVDLATYGEKLNAIVAELNARDPFTALKKGYEELRAAKNDLKKAEAELKNVRANDLGAEAEQAAIAKVNKAKDKYIKTNNDVKKSQKAIRDSVKELAQQMSELGRVIGGTAGEIITIIGDIGTFTLQAMDGVEQASKQSATAIKAVESASVILTIVSAALQIAQKIMNLIGGDGGVKEYEKAAKIYESYVAILDEVINKQKELIEVMAGRDAQGAYEYALQMIDKQAESARILGKQYLDAGAKWNSHSNGVYQRRNIGDVAWKEWINFANQYGVAIDKADGRMTGLFDMTNEQIRALKEAAPTFFASLDKETQDYLNEIIATFDKIEDVTDAWRESVTQTSFESFESDFTDMLTNMDSSAKDFSKSFQEHMRKALIMEMYKSQFKSQLEQYYKMWANTFAVDSEGGVDVTTNEQQALDNLRNSIVTGAKDAADRINKQFGYENQDALTGAVSGVTEETASLIGGQMNAIRINQTDQMVILRNQLAQLNVIANNTEFCRYLTKLDVIINLLSSSDASLRSQGLG